VSVGELLPIMSKYVPGVVEKLNVPVAVVDATCVDAAPAV
jgi:hypothetical protein